MTEREFCFDVETAEIVSTTTGDVVAIVAHDSEGHVSIEIGLWLEEAMNTAHAVNPAPLQVVP